jgi:hypothetical protein
MVAMTVHTWHWAMLAAQVRDRSYIISYMYFLTISFYLKQWGRAKIARTVAIES